MKNGHFPPARYRARVTRRRGFSDRGQSAVELTFSLESGHLAGRLVAGKFWNPILVQRAMSLHENQLVDIDVITTVSRRGKRFSTIKDFRPAGQPSVVMFVGGVCTADPANPRHVKHDYAPSAVCTEMDLPDLEESRAYLREKGIDPPPVPLLHVKVLAALNDRIVHGTAAPIAAGPAYDATKFIDDYRWSMLVVGGKAGMRSFVPADDTFAGYAQAAPELQLGQPAHLSVFRYGDDARLYAKAHGGSVAGYRGVTWARWNVVELDGRPALADAIGTARRFVTSLIRLGITDDRILIFFSGGRSLHVMFPATVAGTTPQTNYEYATGQFCQVLVDQATLMLDTPAESVDRWADDATWHEAIDWNIYKPNAMLRAPNTKHEATGLYKVRLDLDELMSLDAEAIKALAKEPRPFNVVMPPAGPQPGPDALLCNLWQYALAVAGSRTFAMEQIVDLGSWVYADTFAFMHGGAPEQTRATRLFRAAVNLLQIGCPRTAVYQLLSPAALMSGLAPGEIKHQLEGAIRHMQKPRRVVVEPGLRPPGDRPRETHLAKENEQ